MIIKNKKRKEKRKGIKLKDTVRKKKKKRKRNKEKIWGFCFFELVKGERKVFIYILNWEIYPKSEVGEDDRVYFETQLKKGVR